MSTTENQDKTNEDGGDLVDLDKALQANQALVPQFRDNGAPAAGEATSTADETKAAEPAPRTRRGARVSGGKPASQNPAKTGEKRVLIQLHDSPDVPPAGVFIGVNGYGYTLKPGAPARVPVSVLGVLETAVVKRPVYAGGQDTGKIVAWSEAPRYAFTRIGDPE